MQLKLRGYYHLLVHLFICWCYYWASSHGSR